VSQPANKRLATEQALADGLARMTDLSLLKPGIPLDIWPGMNPVPSTYAAWIAGIDADLGSAATKTVIGQDSYGHDMHLYDAGTPGRTTVMLTSGQHPYEFLGQVGCRQFFVQFATSTHPAMATLRQRIRLLWIPTVVAGDFRNGRENANGVNTNRNYPWNWARNTELKGAAPLDQPETQAIKSVLDTYPVAMLIDCHNFGPSADTVARYAAPAPSLHGKPLTVEKAAQAWISANPDAPAPVQYADQTDLRPVLHTWAHKYLRYDLGRTNAMTMILDGFQQPAAGYTSLPQNWVRWYSSFIYQGILAWLETGQADEPVPPFLWLATHNLSSGGDTTAIDAGNGRLIDTATWKALTFSFTSAGSTRNYLNIPIRHPGRYEINASVHLSATIPNGAGPAQVEVGLSFTDATGMNVGPAANSVRTVSLDVNDEHDSVSLQYSVSFDTIPPEAVYAAQLWLRLRSVSTGRTALILSGSGVQMSVKPYWNVYPNFQPLVTS
jgi:hypothetical protein